MRASPELRDVGEVKVVERVLVLHVIPVERVWRQVVEQVGDFRRRLGHVGSARNVHLHEVAEGGQFTLIWFGAAVFIATAVTAAVTGEVSAVVTGKEMLC